MSHIEAIVDVVANDAATSDVDIALVVAVASVDALALAVVLIGDNISATSYIEDFKDDKCDIWDKVGYYREP